MKRQITGRHVNFWVQSIVQLREQVRPEEGYH